MRTIEKILILLAFIPFGIYLFLRSGGMVSVIVRRLNLPSYLAREHYGPELLYLFIYTGLFLLFILLFPKFERVIRKAISLNERYLLLSLMVFTIFFSHFYFFRYFKTSGLKVVEEEQLVYWEDGERKTARDKPLSVWDEGGNMVTARLIHQQGLSAYFQIHKSNSIANWRMGNHPPLYFTILSLFGSHYIGMRYFSIILMILNVLLTFLIGKEIKNARFGLIAGFLFLCMNYYFFYSMRAENDILVTSFILITLYFWMASGKGRLSLPLAGLFMGLAFLTKYSAFLILPILFIDTIVKKRYRSFGLVLAISILVFSPWLIILFLEGNSMQAQHLAWFRLPPLPGTAQAAAGGTLQYLLQLPKDIGLSISFLALIGLIFLIPNGHKRMNYLLPILCVAVFYLAPFFKLPKPNYAMPGAPLVAILASYAIFKSSTSLKIRSILVFISFLIFIIKLQLDIFYFVR